MLRTRRPLLVLIAIIALLVVGYVVKEVDGGSGSTGSGGQIAQSALPAQARQTIKAIKAGGPFPYSADGTVFRNDQHLLPAESSGYYHEYTVTTPGASNRATRRIITGKNNEFYYTADHYASFHRVQLNR